MGRRKHSVRGQELASTAPTTSNGPRHTALIRVTHWITTLSLLALLVTGIEILISHPRFYWGEAGNISSRPLFDLPIPASRPDVPTGYSFVLPDQNGWSRSLHFQAGWILVLNGLVYAVSGLLSGHFRKNLLPDRADLSRRALSRAIAGHLHFRRPDETTVSSYNVLQRLSYLLVIFALVPLMIWTGLAMSPGFTSAFPFTVSVFGGQQSARTIHFFGTLLLVLFVSVHIVMICLAGFRNHIRAMITGRAAAIQVQQ
jgi:thiosulfate reductase cytochrome b subunit